MVSARSFDGIGASVVEMLELKGYRSRRPIPSPRRRLKGSTAILRGEMGAKLKVAAVAPAAVPGEFPPSWRTIVHANKGG